MLTRRSLFRGLGACAVVGGVRIAGGADDVQAIQLPEPEPNEDIIEFIRRRRGKHDPRLYAQILGAANEFKEGDRLVGVAAADDASRRRARQLLERTQLRDLDTHAPHQDQVYRYARAHIKKPTRGPNSDFRLADLKRLLLSGESDSIRAIMPTLSSDVIGCVVKLMDDRDLIRVSQKVFNPLPGTKIGAKGYLGARIQPNSPTDNIDDIRWQVFDGWSFAVGDVLLGTNPVSSEPQSVAAIEKTLQDLLTTFRVDHLLPHCVLSHIDVQAEVEQQTPGSTALWFQSIAGVDTANETFDISVDKMSKYAAARKGRYGLYFETGQGADFTNGHGHGFDMVLHESRKYGFARALTDVVAGAARNGAAPGRPWVHLNDVAGFIGPEVFRTREQLVRCCLEDIVMGKLHGLCIGLDVCSTLHMDVSLDDLDWCLQQIMPANPAYLMALPTKIDPMLGYLTTGYQDHVRMRERFGFRVNDEMWEFFQALGVINEDGQPTEHFGDPIWVFQQYQRRTGDTRTDAAIQAEGRRQLAEVRSRGLFIAAGHGAKPSDLEPTLRADIGRIYDDAKLSIWAEFEQPFIDAAPEQVELATNSTDREDYILHPATGEQLNASTTAYLGRLRRRQAGQVDVQIVISDGLNALAIMEDGHLKPFLLQLRRLLEERGKTVSPEHLVVRSGRVRAGYRIGEALFAGLNGPRAILHLIGERPGSGHRTFSTYITAPDGETWSKPDAVDHNITKVVSGIAKTALKPLAGAREVDRLLGKLLES